MTDPMRNRWATALTPREHHRRSGPIGQNTLSGTDANTDWESTLSFCIQLKQPPCCRTYESKSLLNLWNPGVGDTHPPRMKEEGVVRTFADVTSLLRWRVNRRLAVPVHWTHTRTVWVQATIVILGSNKDWTMITKNPFVLSFARRRIGSSTTRVVLRRTSSTKYHHGMGS
jgi:hypothetical protein